MKMLLANVLLALIWAAMSGDMTIGSVLFGLVVGYFVLLLTQRLRKEETRYFGKVWHTSVFVLFFLKEMIVASLRVAYDILTPARHNQPGIIAYPIEGLSSLEITIFATVVSLTPGTLSLDVSEDRKWLYIHAMFIENSDALKHEIHTSLEKPLLEVMR